MTGNRRDPFAWLADTANLEGWLRTDWDMIREQLAEPTQRAEDCRHARNWPSSEGLI